MTAVIGMTRAAAVWFMYLYIKWSALDVMNHPGGSEQFREALKLFTEVKKAWVNDEMHNADIARYLHRLNMVKNYYGYRQDEPF